MPQYQRREVQDWLNLFEQQKQSGLTAVEFCRQQQINVQTYYTRRRDIRLQRTSSKFVQVMHVPAHSDHPFRFNPITDFGLIRSPISVLSDQK